MEQRHFGQYEVLGEIGKGTQTMVYRAHDAARDRVVALKVLHPNLASQSQVHRRFQREARLAASLNHPNIATIYHVGEEAGQPYIAMEFLSMSLRHLIQAEGRLSVERAIGTAHQVAQGLRAAHQKGIVHRNIKPENILPGPDGAMKVTDFGITRALDVSSMSDAGPVGTWQYMSPEQAGGEIADIRSDIYALGIMLYEMLTGESPFAADTPLEGLQKHVQEEPLHVCHVREDVPQQVEAIVQRCLEKDPAGRYQTPQELAEELEEVLTGVAADVGPEPTVPVQEEAAAQEAVTVAGPEPMVHVSQESSPREAAAPAGWPRERLPFYLGLAVLLLAAAYPLLTALFWRSLENGSSGALVPFATAGASLLALAAGLAIVQVPPRVGLLRRESLVALAAIAGAMVLVSGYLLATS